MIDRKSFIKRRFGIDLESGQLPHMELQILNAIIDQQNKDIAELEIKLAANARQIEDHQKTINDNIAFISGLYKIIEEKAVEIVGLNTELERRENPRWAIKHLWKIFKS
jgi:hypothetical protein